MRKAIYLVPVFLGAAAIASFAVIHSKSKKKKDDEYSALQDALASGKKKATTARELADAKKKIGKTIYPSGTYANVRSSAVVDTGIIWFNNFVRKVNSGSPIGTVADALLGDDGYIWYRIAENEFVREDVIKF